MSQILKFKKILPVQSPQRANYTDAGIDFFVPDYTPQFAEEFVEKNKSLSYGPDGIVLKQGERCLIPSGIKVNVPDGHMLCAFNKSGISTKKGLVVGAQVVDQDYRGQVHISLINTSNTVVLLSHGEKVVQFVLIPVSYSYPQEVNDEDELYPAKSTSSRGENGFGSTDKIVNV